MAQNMGNMEQMGMGQMGGQNMEQMGGMNMQQIQIQMQNSIQNMSGVPNNQITPRQLQIMYDAQLQAQTQAQAQMRAAQQQPQQQEERLYRFGNPLLRQDR